VIYSVHIENLDKSLLIWANSIPEAGRLASEWVQENYEQTFPERSYRIEGVLASVGEVVEDRDVF
jgi:lactam utilization protein B